MTLYKAYSGADKHVHRVLGKGTLINSTCNCESSGEAFVHACSVSFFIGPTLQLRTPFVTVYNHAPAKSISAPGPWRGNLCSSWIDNFGATAPFGMILPILEAI